MWALLRTGLVVLVEHVLTPRGNDMYPGTWTDGHLSPTENLPKFGDSFNQAIMRFGLPGREPASYRNRKPETRIPAVLRGRLAGAIVNVRIHRLPTVAGSLSTMRALTG